MLSAASSPASSSLSDSDSEAPGPRPCPPPWPSPSTSSEGKRWSKVELYEAAAFPWTIIDGRVYAIGDFLPCHPGGRLICRAVGEEASELFHAHHTSRRAYAVLASLEIGLLVPPSSAACPCPGRDLQRLLHRRVGALAAAPEWPLAEGVAVSMLAVFAVWAALCYVGAWWRLNIMLQWFWWRHLDSGLHSVSHGDFRHRPSWQRWLHQVYSLLSHHVIEYYSGEPKLRGMGLPKHLWHHMHTNDPSRDPDWETMTSEPVWVRRHASVRWRPYHVWQRWYWLAIPATLEAWGELLNMGKTCIDAVARLLEPPVPEAGPLSGRFIELAKLGVEVLFNPGYQGLAFCFQPWWQALGTLLLARAISRLVLFPFAEVQHYMPEHVDASESLYPGACAGGEAGSGSGAGGGGDEWVLRQLRTTANLRFDNPLARTVDFLMFHGDSYQIEHHLWPAMSFVHYRRASQIVRATCRELGLPYHEVTYWDGYAKIRAQVRAHAEDPQGGHRRAAPPPGADARDARDARGAPRKRMRAAEGDVATRSVMARSTD